MTAKNEIDWSGIRANAVHMGIRAAARQAAANLTEQEQERFVFRVLKRAQRQGWEEQRKQSQALAVPTQAKPLSSPVLNGADSAAQMLVERRETTRTNLSKWTVNASTQAAEHPEPLEIAQNVKHLAGVVTALWPEQQQPGVNINLWGSGSMSQE